MWQGHKVKGQCPKGSLEKKMAMKHEQINASWWYFNIRLVSMNIFFQSGHTVKCKDKKEKFVRNICFAKKSYYEQKFGSELNLCLDLILMKCKQIFKVKCKISRVDST